MPNETEIKERAMKLQRELGIIWLRSNGNMDKLLEALSPILAKAELETQSVVEAMLQLTRWVDDFGSVTALKKQTNSFAERLTSLEGKLESLSKEIITLRNSKIDVPQAKSEIGVQPKPVIKLPGDTK